MRFFDRFRPGPKEVAPPRHIIPSERVPERSQSAMKLLEDLRKQELGKTIIDERPPESARRIAQVSEKMAALELSRYNEVREFMGAELMAFARAHLRKSVRDLNELRRELAEAPGKLGERVRQLEGDVVDLKKRQAGGSPEEVLAHISAIQKREEQAGNVRRMLEAWSRVKQWLSAIDALPAEKE